MPLRTASVCRKVSNIEPTQLAAIFANHQPTTQDTVLQMTNCPALFISAPASGQGKTSFTAALARYHRNQGRTVRVFKTGPDFLDPMILARASGHPVYQLDLWMVGEAACKHLLFDAAQTADLILIEGVMGLFDGRPSGADLARAFGIPVIALIDARAMAQTFGAIAHGLRHYQADLPFAGVVANYVASAGHADMLAESLPEDMNMLGCLMRDENIRLPDRHLGLVQADEIEDLEQRLEAAAQQIANTALRELPTPIPFNSAPLATIPAALKGKRIGIARDSSFAFIYPANIDLLQAMGAECCYFSPLDDTSLPEVDGLWLPGGYPELHLQQLSDNTQMHTAIRAHHQAGKPILAECGGMLYLFNSLTDKQGQQANMVGLMEGEARMASRLVSLGMQGLHLDGHDYTAHTFHHSELNTPLEPVAHGIRQRGNKQGEAVYKDKGLVASYLHLYFPSCAEGIARIFNGTE